MEMTLQRKRKYTPKVRTGCVTCKKRRVKCDEAKPFCQRCESSGYQCDGYVVVVARVFEPSSAASTPPTQLRIPSPLALTYGGSEESQSLQFFLKRTGPVISMYSTVKDFWTVVIPQSSWSLPPVKHMLVAVALTDQYLTGQLPVQKDQGDFVRAYHYYNKAIQGLTEGQPPMTCVLLSCILAWAFETMTNHSEAANVHMRAATRMLAQSLTTIGASEKDMVISSLSAIVDEANQSAKQAIARQSKPPPIEFETLHDARRYLECILEFVACEDLSLEWCASQARSYLITFVNAFTDYRTRGPEPADHKRAVFLVYNSLRTFVQVEEITNETSMNGKLWDSILCDIEYVLEHQNDGVLNLEWCLKLLVAAVIHHCPAQEQRDRALKLRRRIQQGSEMIQ